jgi:hypothetical protein
LTLDASSVNKSSVIPYLIGALLASALVLFLAFAMVRRRQPSGSEMLPTSALADGANDNVEATENKVEDAEETENKAEDAEETENKAEDAEASENKDEDVEAPKAEGKDSKASSEGPEEDETEREEEAEDG